MTTIERIDALLALAESLVLDVKSGLTYCQDMTDIETEDSHLASEPAHQTRHRALFHITGIPFDEHGLATYQCRVFDDPPYAFRTLHMHRDVVQAMGSPTVITVTVEPGDALNGLAGARNRVAYAELDLIEQVRQARRSGQSWAEIGRAFDMTRQAAWEQWHGDMTVDDEP